MKKSLSTLIKYLLILCGSLIILITGYFLGRSDQTGIFDGKIFRFKTNIKMACHLADWAFFAEPENREVQKLIMDIYSHRIMDPQSTTQEMLVYLDHMALVRGLMKEELNQEL